MMWQDCNGQHASDKQCFYCPTSTADPAGFLARRGLRLTARGEALLTGLMAFALVGVGYLMILLWAAGGVS